MPVIVKSNTADQPSLNLEKISDCYQFLISTTGENTQRYGLVKTPDRAAKAFQDLTAGYHQNLTDLVNEALFPCDNNEAVVINDIEFYSLCEHHLLPFFGRCSVAYIPNGQIIGLSKIPRLVNMFARRLQTQETLSQQIANTLEHITGATSVVVKMTADHMCMKMRGVHSQLASTTTYAVVGLAQKDRDLKKELLGLFD